MAEIPARQQECREAFGKALSAWMRLNGWSQQMIHDAAKAWELAGPWNSQVSLLQRGRLDMKAQLWVSLAEFNANVAAQNLSGLTNRRLRDAFTDSEPYITATGQPATASDMFAQFVGEQPIAAIYTSMPEFSDVDAERITSSCRQQFRELAMRQMLSPAEAWQHLEPLCNGMDDPDRARFREVLSGWAEWSADELNAMSLPGGKTKPAAALELLAAADPPHS